MGQSELSIDVGKYPIEFGQGIEFGLLIGGKSQAFTAAEEVFQPLLGDLSKLKHSQSCLPLNL